MKHFIQNHFRLLLVLLISTIGLSSCVVHETSHRGRRPVVIVQDSHPKYGKHHNKNSNKYKNKHHKQKKHKHHKGHRRDD